MSSSSSESFNHAKRAKIEEQYEDLDTDDESLEVSEYLQGTSEQTKESGQHPALPRGNTRDDFRVEQLFKISSSKELKCFNEDTSEHCFHGIDVVDNRPTSRDDLCSEEKLGMVEFMMTNRKKCLKELENFLGNNGSATSQYNNGTNGSNFLSSSSCEREEKEGNNSERNSIAYLKHMMPSFHVIEDIDRRLAQFNVRTSLRSHELDSDLVFQALDMLTNCEIDSMSPYPITEFLYKSNNKNNVTR